MKQRIWEIDYFRGIAIILMVIFHLIVDMRDFHSYSFEYQSGFWYYEGKLSAILFIYIAGISSTLNRRSTRHGIKLLAAAMLVSGATYLFSPATYVRFGILHLLSLSILMSPILMRLPSAILGALAAALLLLPRLLEQLTNDSGLLLPLGVTPAAFVSMDYYPLIPWLAVFVLGLLTGRHVYRDQQSILPAMAGANTLSKLGRHSLFIYLIHQPLMLALLALVLGRT
ncbi:MAG: hypothetical protein K0Q77_1144 [Anaerosporomusa subterranea]|jgi:uncharacterized membrane protein|nr:hypothetical protein [Anaerosporomusa subterranea]